MKVNMGYKSSILTVVMKHKFVLAISAVLVLGAVFASKETRMNDGNFGRQYGYRFLLLFIPLETDGDEHKWLIEHGIAVERGSWQVISTTTLFSGTSRAAYIPWRYPEVIKAMKVYDESKDPKVLDDIGKMMNRVEPYKEIMENYSPQSARNADDAPTLQRVALYQPNDVLVSRIGDNATILAEYIRQVQKVSIESAIHKSEREFAVIVAWTNDKTIIYTDAKESELKSDLENALPTIKAIVPPKVTGPVMFAIVLGYSGAKKFYGPSPHIEEWNKLFSPQDRVPKVLPDALFK